MRRALALSALVMLASCGDSVADARPQWVVSIVTDAAVPQFGDRLYVEILDAGGSSACAGCRRQIPIGADTAWPVELGIVPPPSGTARVRVRLHRSSVTGPDGLPSDSAVIDALGSLPPLEGVTNVVVTLAMGCFGVPSDVAAQTSCDPVSHAIVAETTLSRATETARQMRPGDWAPGRPKPCPSDPPPEMACVPGGAFLLGDAQLLKSGSATDARPERLVVASPFAIDRAEVTVGTVRKLLGTGLSPTGLFSKTDDATCTFVRADDPSNDAHAVSCVTSAFAERACAAMGKRLPTEAQWERAAWSGDREQSYPWGALGEVCEKAILGRGRHPNEGAALLDLSTSCRVPASQADPVRPWGPVPGGSPLDVTLAGVHDMGGNLDEWTSDSFALYTDPCWSPSQIPLTDPACVRPEERRATIRGAHWASVPLAAAVAFRQPFARTSWASTTGFRCAKSF